MVQAGSYPPDRHVLRDLRLEIEHGSAGASRAWLPVTPEVQTPSGAVRAGALVTLVDALAGGLAAMAAAPNWIATADLALHLVPGNRGPAVEHVEARASLLRAGRTTVVVEVDLFDMPARNPSGLATMTFSVLQRRDTNPTVDLRPLGTPVRGSMAVEGSGFDVALDQAVGLAVMDAAAGAVELAVTEYVNNSLGAVQGGVLGMMVDAAAANAATAACGVPVETVDLQITYLELGKVGPIRTRSRLLVARNGRGTAQIEVYDAGAEDRLMSLATAVCVR